MIMFGNNYNHNYAASYLLNSYSALALRSYVNAVIVAAMEINALALIAGGYSSLTNGNEGDVLANNQITSYANLVLQHLNALNGLPFNIQHEYATNYKLKLLFNPFVRSNNDSTEYPVCYMDLKKNNYGL